MWQSTSRASVNCAWDCIIRTADSFSNSTPSIGTKLEWGAPRVMDWGGRSLVGDGEVMEGSRNTSNIFDNRVH